MEPMKPMKTMAPLSDGKQWWPQEYGEPSTSGAQNEIRYVFFPNKHRLLIERAGKLTTYDTGNHHISGVSQVSSQEKSLAFTSQDGPVKLDELQRVD